MNHHQQQQQQQQHHQQQQQQQHQQHQQQHHQHRHHHAGPHQGPVPGVGVFRPSPLPSNAPTEQEILAEMAMRAEAQQQQQQQQQSRMHQPGPPIQPSREEVLQLIGRHPLIPELLKTPEALSLQTAVQNGGPPMLNTLLYQFVFGQMEPAKREILIQVKSIFLL
jgi:hypothetical protein